MESQCNDSSRTDQEMICPIPFIFPNRGKFSKTANEANSCSPSVNAPNAARVRAISNLEETLNPCMKSNLSFISLYFMKAVYSISGMPMVSSRWLYAAMWMVSVLENADSIISTSVGLNTRE